MTDEVAVHHRVPPYVLMRPGPSRCSRAGSPRPSTTSRSPRPTSRRSAPCRGLHPRREPAPREPVTVRRREVHREFHDLDEAADDLQTDLLAALSGEPESPTSPSSSPTRGRARGKKVLDTLRGNGARVIDAHRPSRPATRPRPTSPTSSAPPQGHRRGRARARGPSARTCVSWRPPASSSSTTPRGSSTRRSS